MTPSSDSKVLLDLAERCEAATGPDRELDAEIARLVVPGCDAVEHDENCAGWLRKSGWAFGCWKAPEYSASLDAAMTLVPEGFRLFSLGEGRYMTRQPAFCAQLEIWTSENGIDGSKHRSIGVAATPALALCVAALRARSPTTSDLGGEAG